MRLYAKPCGGTTQKGLGPGVGRTIGHESALHCESAAPGYRPEYPAAICLGVETLAQDSRCSGKQGGAAVGVEVDGAVHLEDDRPHRRIVDDVGSGEIHLECRHAIRT